MTVLGSSDLRKVNKMFLNSYKDNRLFSQATISTTKKLILALILSIMLKSQPNQRLSSIWSVGNPIGDD